MKTRTLVLTEAEFQHLQVTLEGCKEELEEVMSRKAWFVTALPERIDQCLELLESAKETHEQ